MHLCWLFCNPRGIVEALLLCGRRDDSRAEFYLLLDARSV